MEMSELTREHCLVGVGLDAREQQFLGLEKTLLAGQGHRHAPVPQAGFRTKGALAMTTGTQSQKLTNLVSEAKGLIVISHYGDIRVS